MCERMLRMDGTWYFNSASREFLEDRFNKETLSEEDCLLAKAIRDADRERARLAFLAELKAKKEEEEGQALALMNALRLHFMLFHQHEQEQEQKQPRLSCVYLP